MRKKWILALTLCTLLMGCGQSGGQRADTRESGNGQSPAPWNQEVVSEEKTNEQNYHSQELHPVHLENAYQRAAYLADQVYQANRQANTLVSPLSLELALGLAAEGASGETASELYKYLGDEHYADWAQQYMEAAKSMESSTDGYDEEDGLWHSSRYSFCYELANSIWVCQGDQLSEEYQKTAREKFFAEAENVDFVKKADETANRINDWCREKTHEMIPKIVDPSMFSDTLSAILMNTVYFESPWVSKWALTEHSFTDFSGRKTTQEMLADTLGVYYENEKCTAFAKNYYNGFRFIGILPKEEGEFQISDLDIKSLLDSESYDYDVKVIAPKLNFDTEAQNIVSIMKAQGVTKMFDEESAEFDRLVDGKALYVSDIIQKCRIEMDEEGTRAAAVTALLMTANAALVDPTPRIVKEVYLDRPFAFLIYDSYRDQIVFVGKVTNVAE